MISVYFEPLLKMREVNLPDKVATKPRDMRLDALRGLFLIIMAGVHVPTPVSHIMQDSYGCNGAAEGFIFLSACLAGRVYGKHFRRDGWAIMSRRIWKRTRLIYLIHLGVLLPATLIVWALARKMPPLANHFSDFLIHPLGSLALMPLFDILPLYVIFLGVTPWLLAVARRRGWKLLLAVSALGWLAAQFGLDARLFGDPAQMLPLRWGAFDFCAWQFLWMCGVAIGESSLWGPVIKPRYRPVGVIVGLAIVLAALYWRWGFQLQAPMNPEIFRWMDKWTLGPLRLLAFAGWVTLFLSWNPHPFAFLLKPSALLGRHSLGVFAFHLPLVIVAATVVQMLPLADVWQITISLLVIALLFPWAGFLEWYKRKRNQTALAVPFKNIKPPFPAIQNNR